MTRLRQEVNTLQAKLAAAEKETRLAQDLLKDEEWAHKKTQDRCDSHAKTCTALSTRCTSLQMRSARLETQRLVLFAILFVSMIAVAIKVTVLS